MPETKARRPSKKGAKAAGVEEPRTPGQTDPEDENEDDTELDDGDDNAGAEQEGDGTGPDDPSQPAKTTVTIEVPEGMSLVPTAVLDDLKLGVAAGREARQVQLDRHRDTKIAAAIDKGKFAPAQREHFQKLWASDPNGTEQLIDVLAENVIPVEQRSVGHSEEQAVAASTYPGGWLSESEAAVVAARNGKVQ